MFSKPFNLILIYILSVINLLILFLPIIFAFSPLFLISEKQFLQGIIDISYLSFFVISSFMILYLLFDCVFGFTIWGLTKHTRLAEKYEKEFEFIPELLSNFKGLQLKFNAKNVTLLISKSDEVNAYAIGSLRKKVIVLTMGIIVYIREQCDSEEEFQIAIKAILGHEMSHLVNKDFLPTLLLFANEKATHILLRIVHLFFRLIIKLVYTMPVIGSTLYNVVSLVHRITHFIINFFHRFIILKVFSFLKLYISRKTEYRCDYQAALACGGDNTAFALSFLGKTGFITIFSTHPNTSSRIRHVKNVEQKKGRVRVSFVNRFSNVISIGILFVILGGTWNYIQGIEYLQINRGSVGQEFNRYGDFFDKNMKSMKEKLERLF